MYNNNNNRFQFKGGKSRWSPQGPQRPPPPFHRHPGPPNWQQQGLPSNWHRGPRPNYNRCPPPYGYRQPGPPSFRFQNLNFNFSPPPKPYVNNQSYKSPPKGKLNEKHGQGQQKQRQIAAESATSSTYARDPRMHSKSSKPSYAANSRPAPYARHNNYNSTTPAPPKGLSKGQRQRKRRREESATLTTKAKDVGVDVLPKSAEPAPKKPKVDTSKEQEQFTSLFDKLHGNILGGDELTFAKNLSELTSFMKKNLTSEWIGKLMFSSLKKLLAKGHAMFQKEDSRKISLTKDLLVLKGSVELIKNAAFSSISAANAVTISSGFQILFNKTVKKMPADYHPQMEKIREDYRSTGLESVWLDPIPKEKPEDFFSLKKSLMTELAKKKELADAEYRHEIWELMQELLRVARRDRGNYGEYFTQLLSTDVKECSKTACVILWTLVSFLKFMNQIEFELSAVVKRETLEYPLYTVFTTLITKADFRSIEECLALRQHFNFRLLGLIPNFKLIDDLLNAKLTKGRKTFQLTKAQEISQLSLSFENFNPVCFSAHFALPAFRKVRSTLITDDFKEGFQLDVEFLVERMCNVAKFYSFAGPADSIMNLIRCLDVPSTKRDISAHQQNRLILWTTTKLLTISNAVLHGPSLDSLVAFLISHFEPPRNCQSSQLTEWISIYLHLRNIFTEASSKQQRIGTLTSTLYNRYAEVNWEKIWSDKSFLIPFECFYSSKSIPPKIPLKNGLYFGIGTIGFGGTVLTNTNTSLKTAGRTADADVHKKYMNIKHRIEAERALDVVFRGGINSITSSSSNNDAYPIEELFASKSKIDEDKYKNYEEEVEIIPYVKPTPPLIELEDSEAESDTEHQTVADVAPTAVVAESDDDDDQDRLWISVDEIPVEPDNIPVEDLTDTSEVEIIPYVKPPPPLIELETDTETLADENVQDQNKCWISVDEIGANIPQAATSATTDETETETEIGEFVRVEEHEQEELITNPREIDKNTGEVDKNGEEHEQQELITNQQEISQNTGEFEANPSTSIPSVPVLSDDQGQELRRMLKQVSQRVSRSLAPLPHLVSAFTNQWVSILPDPKAITSFLFNRNINNSTTAINTNSLNNNTAQNTKELEMPKYPIEMFLPPDASPDEILDAMLPTIPGAFYAIRSELMNGMEYHRLIYNGNVIAQHFLDQEY